MTQLTDYHPMLPRLLRPEKYAELSGISVEAQRKKREKGYWLEGREYHLAPDRRVMVDWQEVERWVTGENR